MPTSPTPGRHSRRKTLELRRAAHQAAMSTWLRDQNLLELLLKTASGATDQPPSPHLPGYGCSAARP